MNRRSRRSRPAGSVSRFVLSLIAGTFLAATGPVTGAEPLHLNPRNPHYFEFRGKPEILITSGEHYGAVLNLDFDYIRYLDTLEANHLNLTRTFSGAYVEPQGAFRIAQNTLAPKAGRFICPWARSSTPGYANGGNKFDLTRWDPDYFRRLKDFVRQASRRGIVVEMNLFCPFYGDAQWKLSPQNAANNVNGIGGIARTNAYTLHRNGGLLAVQEAMTRKIVTELNPFDNVYYEICNEPYFGGVTLAWQHHIARLITQTEARLPHRHLISQNIANGKRKVGHPFPEVSIFNFHYAQPPVTVALNYGLEKVIGDNETGFRGTQDAPYRREGWEFILAGGGLFNNLDYSFTAGHEDGTFVYPKHQPGGGNRTLRKQLSYLRDFIHRFDFVKMHPDPQVIRSGLSQKTQAYTLAEPGKQYAIYLLEGSNLQLELALPPGRYQAQWFSPLSGRFQPPQQIRSSGKPVGLTSPAKSPEIALRIIKDNL